MVQAHATGSDFSWRAPLADALEQLPAERRRQPRSWKPSGTAGLQSTTPGSRPLLDLASNDYLGLASHPDLLEAAGLAMQREGVGSGASRLVSGGRGVHDQLEARLAVWLQRERVLLFPSGFQANLAAVQALADRHTLVLADRLIHHSLLVGIRASGARLQRFAHNQLTDLEQRLAKARRDQPNRRLLVISESLFSMEGTSPDLEGLSARCKRFDAALLLDEAHALGVLGPGGCGLGHGLGGISLISGTFGKAFGSGGAFLAGDGLVGEWLLQHSGPYRYTTALAPPLAAAALAALTNIQQHPERASQLVDRAERWRNRLEQAGWPRPPGYGPILPLLVGDDRRALSLQQQLEQAGLLSVAIRPPTVPEGTARLRLVLRHDLPRGSLDLLLRALGTP
ncbi:MAG: hypothetical protein RLZZ515_178 [Cyanobacteriota bacterium]